MGLATDIAGDFEALTDDLKAVTLVKRDATEVAITKALRRAISHREAANSDGKYISGDVRFHFATSQVAARPELGAYIEDDDGNWRILEVGTETLNNRYACVCRNLAIVNELNTILTLQSATYAKGSGGAQEPTWANVSTTIRGKVQVASADRETTHDTKQLPRLATIYLETQILAVNTNYRFLGPDGTIYKVLGWDGPDRSDALFSVRCEVTNWPMT